MVGEPFLSTSEDEIVGTLMNSSAGEQRSMIKDTLEGRLDVISGTLPRYAIMAGLSLMGRMTGTPSPWDLISEVKRLDPGYFSMMPDFEDYVIDCSLLESRHNTEWHLEQIISNAAKRELSNISKMVDLHDDVTHTIGVIRKELDRIESGAFKRDKQFAFNEYSHDWEQIFSVDDKEQLLLPTGFPSLDEVIGGIGQEDFFVIGARPSVGKTAFAVKMADAIMRAGHPVSFYSYDMGRKQFQLRLASFYTGLTVREIRKKQFDNYSNKEGWSMLSKAYDIIGQLPLYLTFRHLDCYQLRRSIIEDAKRGVKAVFIDYIQKVMHPKITDEYAAVTAASNMIKDLTHEIEIPIIPLSQLRRFEGPGDRPPRLSDLRSSGQIEQDASVVLLLHRHRNDRPGAKETMSFEGFIDLAKQQNGALTRVNAKIGRGFRWEEMP